MRTVVFEHGAYKYGVKEQKDDFVWSRGLSLERAVNLSMCLNAVGSRDPRTCGLILDVAESYAKEVAYQKQAGDTTFAAQMGMKSTVGELLQLASELSTAHVSEGGAA